MSISNYSIKNKIIIWMFITICIGGGIFAYENLGRYEDPEFTIKDAKIYTPYPGATPTEVADEITDMLEKEVSQMAQVKWVTSISKSDMSELTVTIKDKYDKNSLPQVWDELRRKVNDASSQLPPGAGPSIVYDDFGDVYGMLFAVTGEGFTAKELENYTEIIQQALEIVPGIAKVQVTGVQQEAIYIDISRNKIAQLGISLDEIFALLKSQNLVSKSGAVKVGDDYIIIRIGGAIDSVEAIGNLMIKSSQSDSMVHLSDISTVRRDFVEVPSHLVYYNGQFALSLGLSIVPGGNVVKIGGLVEQKLRTLSNIIPIGVQIHPIYEQPRVVQASIKGFMINLLEALGIVIVVLVIAMGMRSGLIIAAVLLLTVLGTLLVMYVFGISLERISLGALIIALGMLVDNAIVVTEGILVKVNEGMDKIKASELIVKQTIWPLFGATVIGILAFAPIGLSQDSTGEYTSSLFYVILISLLLSWVLAITIVPLFCYLFLKQNTPKVESKEKQLGLIYRSYRSFLINCLKQRFIVIVSMGLLLAVSVFAFGFVKNSFFPDSTTPLFMVDYWRAEGTDIRATDEDMKEIQTYVSSIEGVTDVTSLVGSGAQRFMLIYSPESTNTSYGQFLVSVKDYRQIDHISRQIKRYILENFTYSEPKIRKVSLGPSSGAKIEVRFSGPDPHILRKLSNQAKRIMRETPDLIDVRDDWRQKIKEVVLDFSEAQSRLTGISRDALNDTLLMTFSGKQVGVYREEDDLIPIISRAPATERLDIANIKDLQIYSPIFNKTVPVTQLVTDIRTQWINAIIARRDRQLTITASAEPNVDEASVSFKLIRPKIEAITLPPGYILEWGGEYEDSTNAQTALAKKIPLGVLSMFAIIVILFNSVRQPIIIWLCVPLSLIGVTIGLLITNQPFGFMALLGFLSLTGMLIKNAIVLIDQIDLEINEGKLGIQAIIDSSMSRLRPVCLAAATTVLGMMPLLTDAFFVSMAVVIMFGLTFATVLTLIFVPVLYAVFGRYRYQDIQNSFQS